MRRRFIKNELPIRGCEGKIDCNTIGISTMFTESKFIYDNRYLTIL